MKNPRQFGKAISISYFFIVTLLALSGFMGYFTYGIEVKPLIQLNFNQKQFISKLANGMLLIKAYSVVALFVYPISSSITSIPFFAANTEKISEYCKAISIRTLLLVLICFIAYVVPKFEFIGNLLGTLCALAMTLIMPGWAYMKPVQMQENDGFGNVPGLKNFRIKLLFSKVCIVACM